MRFVLVWATLASPRPPEPIVESFELRHTYSASRAAVWAALDSPEYTALRTEHGQRPDAKVTQTILSDSLDGQKRVRRIRHTLQRALPRMMQRFTGPQLSYIVTEHIDPSTFTVAWTATPEVDRGGRAVDRRIRIEGSYAFRDLPGSQATCERIVKVEIHVAIPGLGRRIEQGIATSLRTTHESSALLARQFLEARLRPQGSPA